MRIVVDAMGGDNAPEATINGAIAASVEFGVEIGLVGDEKIIQEYLDKCTYDKSNVVVHNSNSVISNDEDPVMAIRRKKDSSIVIACELIKSGKYDALISAGSTGALLAASTLIIGRLENVKRACLSTFIPQNKGVLLLSDIGANVDCTPEMLEQFAVLNSKYLQTVLGVSNPRVGLLNNGSEANKGNSVTKEAYKLFSKADINFYGNVEPRDIFSNVVDIAICDGFAGNMILKASEGLAGFVFSNLKKLFLNNIKTKLAAILVKKEFRELKNSLDHSEYGGAPLLGIKVPVIKAHGSSDSTAFKNGIKQLIKFADSGLFNN